MIISSWIVGHLSLLKRLHIPTNDIFIPADSWEKTWVYSKHEGKEFGAFVRTAGKFFNDEEEDKGKESIFINKIRHIRRGHLRVICTHKYIDT